MDKIKKPEPPPNVNLAEWQEYEGQRVSWWAILRFIGPIIVWFSIGFWLAYTAFHGGPHG